MRILVIAGKHPFMNRSGTENVIQELSDAFTREGHTVFMTINDKKRNESHEIMTEYFPNPFRNIPGGFLLNEIWYAWKIRKYTKIINPDIVLDNASIAFLNQKKPSIVTIAHGTNRGNARARTIHAFGDLFRLLYRKYRGYMQNFLFQKADIIVAVSEKIKQEILELHHMSEEKIVIISNGTSFSPNPEEYTNRLLRKTLKTGIFVSSNHSWKGIEIVETLAEKMPERTFLICGPHYAPTRKNIKYQGNLDRESMRRLYLEADFFILPSRYEGQSLAVLEAMSLGLVIVGGREIDPKISSETIGILLEDRENIEKYVEEMEKLEQNTEKLGHIIESNVEIMKSYSWEKQARKYLDLFEKIEKNTKPNEESHHFSPVFMDRIEKQ